MTREAPGQRFLAVHLPAFRLERCGYGAEDLAALVGERSAGDFRAPGTLRSGATRLVACTPAVRGAGIREGATATEARALVPDIELLPWDPAGEAQDREALRARFEAFSDRVDVLGDGGWDDALLLETTHLPEPEPDVGRRAVALAGELGHRARAAIADDPLAARAIAEWAAPDDGVVVVPPGRGAQHLAELPIEALVLDEAVRCALRAVGVDTLGQWAALDPAAVAARYGDAAARLHHVARGGHGSGVVLELPRDDALPEVRAPLPGATTRQELQFALAGLLSDLCARLEARDLAVVRLRVVLQLDVPEHERGASLAAFTVRAGRATRSPAVLEGLLKTRLDRFTVRAPVDEVRVEVVEAAPEVGWQPGLADRTEASEPLPDLLARLSEQLGEHNLVAAEVLPVWRPERAWRGVAFPRPMIVAPRSARVDDPVELQEGRESAPLLPRPTLLLPRPERLDVGCEGGRPVRVRTERGWRAVARRAGPERLWGEWWEVDPLDRTYWAVEVDGRVLWTFQARDGWWLHGWFD